jgi:NADH-quinone oxidoreductase subunit H
MIPLALGWILLLAAINIGRDEDWPMAAVVGVSFLVLVVGWGTLSLVVDGAQRRRTAALDDEEALI